MTIDIEKLDKLGFFRHVPDANRSRVKAWAVEKQFPFKDETRRIYHIDAEDLAEGAILSIIGLVAPFLRREGVPIEVTYAPVRFPARGPNPLRIATIELDADGWLPVDPYVKPHSLTAVKQILAVFSVGGPLEQIRSCDNRHQNGCYELEVGQEFWTLFNPDDETDAWTQAISCLLSALNDLLVTHGSAERAFGIYGGNDFCLVFSTSEMAKLINAGSEPGHRLHDGTPLAHATSKI